MHLLIFVFLLACVVVGINGANNRSFPVFPGAIGFGANTIAGRGGQIIKVTNLNDSGPGSLRAAIEASGPRIVVFEVSGTITLSDTSKSLVIRNPYITIAGQTAPAPGIQIAGWEIIVRTHDVLIQHLAIRPGNLNRPFNNTLYGNISMLRIQGGADTNNVVVDHVSGAWSSDEGYQVYGTGTGNGTLHNVTISNCIGANPLNAAIAEPTGKMLLISDSVHNVSIIKNYLAHAIKRFGPLSKNDAKYEMINNVLYNNGSTYPSDVWAYIGNSADGKGGNMPCKATYIGNVFKAGSSQSGTTTAIIASKVSIAGTQVYQSGNWTDVGNVYIDSTGGSLTVNSPPVRSNSTALNYVDSIKHVLSNAGSRPAQRDSYDKRVVNDYYNKTGDATIKHEDEVGGFPFYQENYRPFPLPSNPSGDDDLDGYTNIEEVLHQMAAVVEGR